MIPTSIDGTDITGATIDGTDVTEITVDGQTVFTAGPSPGRHFYITDGGSTSGPATLEHYELSTPFDISNLGTADGSVTINDAIDNFDIRQDGSEVYIVNDENSDMTVFDLPTPFNLSSATNERTVNRGTSARPTAFKFHDDGSILYVSANGNLEQYSLPTPYDVTNMNLVGVITDSGEIGEPAFNPSGTLLTYGRRSGSDEIVTGTLSTPFDISTFSETHSVTATTDPSCVKWNGDGTTAVIRHASPNDVNERTTTTPYSVDGMGGETLLFDAGGFTTGGIEFNYNF